MGMHGYDGVGDLEDLVYSSEADDVLLTISPQATIKYTFAADLAGYQQPFHMMYLHGWVSLKGIHSSLT